MAGRWLAGAVVISIAGTAGAKEVATGNSVQVVRARAQGAEAGLPRGGAYGRAVALDARGNHASALREYARAQQDLDSLSDVLDAPASCRAAWRGKIAWQRERSEELLEQEAYTAVTPSSALAHLNLAAVYHRKYLAVRAWLGIAPQALAERAEAEYMRALELDRRNGAARVGLAALHAHLGRLVKARHDFALLGRRMDDPALLLRVAAYQAAIGDRDAAFTALAAVPARAEVARALWSNEFDTLRGDPRFAAVAGAGVGLYCADGKAR